jgi:hypothetical protein
MQDSVVGVVQDPELVGWKAVLASNRPDGCDCPPNPRRTVVIHGRRSDP